MRVLKTFGRGTARLADTAFSSVSVRDFARVFMVLGAIDAVLILTYLEYGIARLSEPQVEIPHLFDITRDWSAGEMANYGKWALAALALAAAWWRWRRPLLLALVAVVLVLLSDDMLRLHERFGSVLADRFDLAERVGPLRGQDIGEILVWSLLGIPVTVALAGGFLATPPGQRGLGVLFVGLLALLVCAGGLADMAAVALDLALEEGRGRIAAGVASVIEDGGEMVVASAICALAVAAVGRMPEEPV